MEQSNIGAATTGRTTRRAIGRTEEHTGVITLIETRCTEHNGLERLNC